MQHVMSQGLLTSLGIPPYQHIAICRCNPTMNSGHPGSDTAACGRKEIGRAQSQETMTIALTAAIMKATQCDILSGSFATFVAAHAVKQFPSRSCGWPKRCVHFKSCILANWTQQRRTGLLRHSWLNDTVCEPTKVAELE